MPMVVYKNCCICIGLRKGCLIIGYLNLLILTCVSIPLIYDMTKGEIKSRVIIFKPQQSSWTFILPESVQLTGLILCFIFTLVLLVGVHGNKLRLVKAFMVYNVSFILVYMVGFFTQLSNINMTMVINDLGVFCVTMNYWLIIRSYYVVTSGEEVENTNRESARALTNV